MLDLPSTADDPSAHRVLLAAVHGQPQHLPTLLQEAWAGVAAWPAPDRQVLAQAAHDALSCRWRAVVAALGESSQTLLAPLWAAGADPFLRWDAAHFSASGSAENAFHAWVKAADWTTAQAGLTSFPKARPWSFEVVVSIVVGDDPAGLAWAHRAGADMNVRNGKKQTPLFLAITPAAVSALLSAGADPEAKDQFGLTAALTWGIGSGDRYRATLSSERLPAMAAALRAGDSAEARRDQAQADAIVRWAESYPSPGSPFPGLGRSTPLSHVPAPWTSAKALGLGAILGWCSNGYANDVKTYEHLKPWIAQAQDTDDQAWLDLASAVTARHPVPSGHDVARAAKDPGRLEGMAALGLDLLQRWPAGPNSPFSRAREKIQLFVLPDVMQHLKSFPSALTEPMLKMVLSCRKGKALRHPEALKKARVSGTDAAYKAWGKTSEWHEDLRGRWLVVQALVAMATDEEPHYQTLLRGGDAAWPDYASTSLADRLPEGALKSQIQAQRLKQKTSPIAHATPKALRL